ncbi:DNA polymerase III subunit [Thermocrinis sp.]
MKVKLFVEKAYRQGRIPQAILFYGKEGVGKREIAFELAQAILCLKKQYPPCGSCSSCRLVKDFFSIPEEKLKVFGESSSGKDVFLYLQGDHPDFICVKPEKTEIKVDQIRAVKDFVYIKPALSNKKVVLIQGAETMNPYAQNALLKVLEEPPNDTFFILVCSNINKILPTIKSRCFLLEIPPLTMNELAEKTGINDPTLLELADGSLELLNQIKEKKELVETALKFLNGDILTAYNIAIKLDDFSEEEQRLFLKVLAFLIHKKYLKERDDSYKLILDRLYSSMEYLGRGLNLALLMFYIYLEGGDNLALYKGSFQGYEEDYTG